MTYNNLITLITGDFKHYEEEIVYFFKKIGEKSGLNSKDTMIFAFLHIYGALTQKQLKQLTNFSSSTISTTLNSFVQSGIVAREITSNVRLGVYKLKIEKVTFVYTEFSEIMKDLEIFDNVIISYQSKIHKYKETYPVLSEFLFCRFNSYRNYIEAQRRAIDGKKKYDYFNENVASLGIGTKVINFPSELEEIMNQFLTYVTKYGIFSQDYPISNIIMSHFSLRAYLTQFMLKTLTNLSLSTISRTLSHLLEVNAITALPKEYQQSCIYILTSFSLVLIKLMLDADAFIFSWKPKFHKLKKSLEQQKSDSDGFKALLLKKIDSIINMMIEFQLGSTRLAKAKHELKKRFESNM